MKNTKWSQKGLKFQYVALNVACWMQKKSWVEISLEKWNAFVTDEFSSETLVLWKRSMVQFVHEVHPVFAVILSTFAHMLCGSNDDTMPSLNLFWVQVVALFQFQGHLAENKSLNAWKIPNDVRKGWNLSMWLWMLHFGCKKKSWVEISLEKWNANNRD